MKLIRFKLSAIYVFLLQGCATNDSNSPLVRFWNDGITYSHSGYDMNKPEAILKDAQGFNINEKGSRIGIESSNNPYYLEHKKLWKEGQINNLVPEKYNNPSLPSLIKPNVK